jgi:Siphovirus ReqiPepy6 Gp37-like protein
MAMEWYTLDFSIRKDEVIENFESFIWTERYSAYGDFQIVTKSTLQSRNQLAEGTWLGMKGSKYVMIIDTVSDDTDENGVRNITVTGSSLEKLLDDRVAMPALANTTTTPNWILTGAPADIARQLFSQICVSGALSQNDTIPFYHLGTLSPAGGIPEPTDIITVTFSPDTLYNSLKSICDTYGLGFRLIRNGELSQIWFEVYTGTDMTSTQTLKNPVIFDPNMDNLEKISLLTSTATLKTVAYVFAQNGVEVVYAPTANPNDTDINRRVLLVNSDNDLVAGAPLTQALQQEGQLALAAQRKVYSFDGELPPSANYVYGKDYHLGDLVEERNSDGYGNQMLVTEQIFSSDNTGEKTYPTLALSQTITPGTWLAWDADQVWQDVDPSITWGSL